MTRTGLASLHDIAERLAAADYAVEFDTLGNEHVLLAESRYALVACMEIESASELPERMSDVQAALTRLVATQPSPLRWDLYLFVHLLRAPVDAREEAIVEDFASDTLYARKLLRTEIDLSDERALDRALRPLLPLEPAAIFDVSEPLEALRAELRELNLSDDVAAAALESFGRGEEVAVP